MKNNKKPKCKLIGEDGNIFFLMGRAGSVLKEHGLHKQAEEMTEKVMNCPNYYSALKVLGEYIEIY